MPDIKRDKKGRWAKGNKSGKRFSLENLRGNLFAKGNPPNSTSFKVGEKVLDRHPSWRGGVQKNKKDCIYIAIAPNVRVRRPRYVWEQANGPLPPGFIIWHKDGNRYNDNLENLEAITRSEAKKRSGGGLIRGNLK